MNLIPLRSPAGNPILDRYGMPLYEETPIDLPDGRATGAVPPATTEGPTALGDLFYNVFAKEIYDFDKWPELIDNGLGDHLKYRAKRTLDQDGVGSCASEGAFNCIMTQQNRRTGKYTLYNPWPIYYYASNGSDRGSSLPANIREIRQRGGVPMAKWPRYDSAGRILHRWNDLPPDDAWEPIYLEVYTLGNTRELGSAMFLGHTVYAAYPGHAWEYIKVLNSEQGLWLNSWGADWGDNGVGVIAHSRIQYAYQLYAFQTAD